MMEQPTWAQILAAWDWVLVVLSEGSVYPEWAQKREAQTLTLKSQADRNGSSVKDGWFCRHITRCIRFSTVECGQAV